MTTPTSTKKMKELLNGDGRAYAPLPVLDTSIKRGFTRKYNRLKARYGPTINMPNSKFTREFNAYYKDLKKGRDKLFEKHIAVVDIGPPSGKAVFAKTEIKKGSIVGLYTGKIVKVGDVEDGGRYAFKALHDGWEKRDDFEWLDDYDIDGATVGSWTTLINSSDTPNVSAQVRYAKEGPVYVLVASTEIAKEEQLFMNYGPEYWENLEIDPVELGRSVSDYPGAKQLL
ncbi:MAG: hypothetical protein SP1CHLAM54_03120 [Chlamydiia bacterium]|nr:hypothetical protein [Chlamydiia bacterium]MCH9615228.1 hypothetical protein [Chlamydiia bacterium]MCH9628450.1 hypothetical protein [Chlamydiia bacterium]